MNMGSKGKKKKMVLPARPEPPSVEQIIEDINRAEPCDPVFRFLQIPNEGSISSDVEVRYTQSRRYLDLNEKLQEALADLTCRRDELRVVGETLEGSVAAVKSRAL
ncbi:UPF0449 protein C19orf25 homolog [Silurus meridionalis]|uniref:Uncharacterized protein n=1 Tax=Silurus meridionalis TaxID=175797 RepID=A0A8T0BCS7_SILME|nr:UPF0449 protein C19orf25 homolog [Silurus meridionalis]KAF7703743.1 hypothetical protein HF521_022750 [Silurus meridionalis]KAI5101891.1 UPF0449 protein C19orf25-like isoform X2 [Silurus meridionalis]